ncbi:hypothetical protein Ancab_038609 [Ancistrocladus abbreviatus]
MEVNSRSTQEVLENECIIDGTNNLKEMVKKAKVDVRLMELNNKLPNSNLQDNRLDSSSHLLAACPLTASSQGSNSRQGSLEKFFHISSDRHSNEKSRSCDEAWTEEEKETLEDDSWSLMIQGDQPRFIWKPPRGNSTKSCCRTRR